MAGKAVVLHSTEGVNRMELAVELVHNKFLPFLDVGNNLPPEEMFL
jgi:hypothetical protein